MRISFRTKLIIGFFLALAIVGSCTGSNKNDKNVPTTTTTTTANQVQTTVTNPTTTTTIEPATTTTFIAVVLTNPTTLSYALSVASTKVLGRGVVDSTTISLFIKAYNQKESSFQLGETNYRPPTIESYAESFLNQRFPQEASRHRTIVQGSNFQDIINGSSSTTTSTTTTTTTQISGTFLCNDGSLSYSSSRQGACSYHGGIK